MPDLNSLPPSQPQSGSNSPLTSRLVPSPSLGTAASHAPSHPFPAPSAAQLHTGSPAMDAERSRRRSSLRASLTSAMPGPASPHRERAPSLGELHQELENEQEAQVNRLLHMIRQQQAQIAALSAGGQATPQAAQSSAVIDDSTPTSERSMSFPPAAFQPSQHNVTIPSAAAAAAPPPSALSAVPSPSTVPRARSPMRHPHAGIPHHSSSRDRSRGSSRVSSPMLRPMVGAAHASSPQHEQDMFLGGAATRDDTAFYQVETHNLTRENQMLKMRIRELERQLSEASQAQGQSPASAAVPATGGAGETEPQPQAPTATLTTSNEDRAGP